MNKIIPIALIVFAAVALLFFIATQTPVSNYIPQDTNYQITSQEQQDNQQSSSSSSSSSSSGSSGGDSGGGSSGSDSSSGSSDSNDEKAPNYCTSESRDVEDCEGISSHIVCGWYSPEIACSTGPCVRMFGNECEACRDETIEYWTDGECPIHG